MKKIGLLTSFFCSLLFYCHGSTAAQSFLVYKSDTINRVDVNKMKQGNWIVFGKMKQGSGFTPNAIVEQGKYMNNRKIGSWIKYYPNGVKKSVILYKNGRPNGHYKTFYENGKLEEEGNWSRNRNTGKFTRFYQNGQKHQEFVFSSNGKRNGVQKYYHDNGKLMIVGNIVDGKEQGEFVEYNKDGTVREKKYFDTPGEANHAKTKTYTAPKKAEQVNIAVVDARKVAKVEKGATQNAAEKKINPFSGTGETTLYNKNKQISQKGYFKNYHLINGLNYKYNKNGILEKVEKFKKGKYVGDAPIEEDK